VRDAMRLIESLRDRAFVAPRKASPSEVEWAETQLGFELPPLLRRVHLEVADGGVGPGYGLLSVRAAVDLHRKLSCWPVPMVPLCDWGCAIWSCLDCRTESGPVVTLAGERGFFESGRHLGSWLQAWLNGVDLWKEMFEERRIVGTNPFTREPIEIVGNGAPKGRAWP
jgi:hypothetical protein